MALVALVVLSVVVLLVSAVVTDRLGELIDVVFESE